MKASEPTIIHGPTLAAGSTPLTLSAVTNSAMAAGKSLSFSALPEACVWVKVKEVGG